MDQIDMIPGLITITLFAIFGVILVWLTHRGDNHHKKQK